jgi:hypothetical protein
MYYELGHIGARAVGEDKPWPYHPTDKTALLLLGAEMSRYDPRLFGILVEHIYFHWMEFNPLDLRHRLKTLSTPQTFLCLLAFVTSALPGGEFRLFADYISSGFQPVPPQLYFMSLYSPGSTAMIRAAEEPMSEFLKWGFLARERPVLNLEGSRLNLGHWSPQARINVALRLARSKSAFQLSDYLAELDGSISRQQALADLKIIPQLKLEGRGRGVMWKLL